MEKEEWRSVVTHKSFYEVSDKGRVKRLKAVSRRCSYSGTEYDIHLPEIIMKASKDSRGYFQVTLNLGGKRVARVHRLVAEAFLGAPSEEILLENAKRGIRNAFVNHMDRDCENNYANNLEWCTVSYNNSYMYDRLERIEKVKGSSNCNAKLTENDVLSIVKHIADGVLSQQRIGELFGVSQMIISNINCGRAWSWLTGKEHIPVHRKPRESSKKLSHR